MTGEDDKSFSDYAGKTWNAVKMWERACSRMRGVSQLIQ